MMYYTLFPGLPLPSDPVLCRHLRTIWLSAHTLMFSIRSRLLRASTSTTDGPTPNANADPRPQATYQL
jgi:hypothetical protein